MGSVVLLLVVLAGIGYHLASGRGRPSRRQLEKILGEAEEWGIIGAGQRGQLLALAGDSSQRLSLSAASWLGIIAGLFVAAGIALVISYNWDRIGPVIRIGGFVLLLAAVGEAAVRSRDRSRALHLPLEFTWFMLPLLGIGLYAQTFQISGEPIRPFLVWLLLTFPVAWLSRYRFAAVGHLVSLAAVLMAGNFTRGMLGITGRGGTWEGADPVAWSLTALIWAGLLLDTRRALPEKHRAHVIGLGAVWTFVLLAADTPFQISDPRWFFVAAVALSTLWMLLPCYLRNGDSARLAGVVPWLGSIYGMTFLWHEKGSFDGALSASGQALVLVLLLGAAAAIATAPFGSAGDKKAGDPVIRAVLLGSLVLALLLLLPAAGMVRAVGILANLSFGAVALLFMWNGAGKGVVWQVNAGVGALLLLLITRFVDVFGDMLRSGVGMIVAGLFLAVVAYGLERGRRRLLAEHGGQES